ncbi:hypothetical protein [Streptomyces sp. NPDC016845]|uniref:hypothetical protein n=1 Tax=Streptomyces sp. NPDC016845 TaxID=3364972 RepID=UPI0037B22168
MAEQERREPESPDSSDSPDSPDGGKGQESGAAGAAGAGQPQRDEEEQSAFPLDEDAVWAQIVAGYGEEPPDPPGAKPFKSVEDLALLEPDTNTTPSAAPGRADEDEADGHPKKDLKADKDPKSSTGPLGSSVSFAPGVGGAMPGPRDHTPAAPSDDDFDADDEGHFVPPEPPPIPEADVTARFAWLAVIGGPVLLLASVLLGWSMTWWLATLCIGGFLGGFATLVARMQSDDDEDDDPGRGAVV